MDAPGQLDLFSAWPATSQSVEAVASSSPTLSVQEALAQARAQRPRRRVVDHDGPMLCVLGSGSGGNCSVLRSGPDAMLIDAGFGPRTVFRRLAMTGFDGNALRAVCVTHLDQDHFRPTWVPMLLELNLPLFLHRWHLAELSRIPGAGDLHLAGLVRTFERSPFAPLQGRGVSFAPVHLPHDDKGTAGFRIETPGGHIGYATDLGHVPAELIDAFVGVDLLCIECNYDPQMQQTSSRPWFLKQRIMGKHGHLSNAQAFEAVAKVCQRCPHGGPSRVVLLHRSAQCNTPDLVRRVFAQDPRIAKRVKLTHQRRRSPWFTVSPRRTPPQGRLF